MTRDNYFEWHRGNAHCGVEPSGGLGPGLVGVEVSASGPVQWQGSFQTWHLQEEHMVWSARHLRQKVGNCGCGAHKSLPAELSQELTGFGLLSRRQSLPCTQRNRSEVPDSNGWKRLLDLVHLKHRKQVKKT